MSYWLQIQLPREGEEQGEDMDTEDQVAQATSSDQVIPPSLAASCSMTELLNFGQEFACE